MSLDAHNNYAYICLALVRAPWRHHKSAVPSANLFGPVEKLLEQGSPAQQGQAIVHFLPGYHLQCLNGGPGRRRSSWLEIAQDSGFAKHDLWWKCKQQGSKAPSGGSRVEGRDAMCILWTWWWTIPVKAPCVRVRGHFRIREKGVEILDMSVNKVAYRNLIKKNKKEL